MVHSYKDAPDKTECHPQTRYNGGPALGHLLGLQDAEYS